MCISGLMTKYDTGDRIKDFTFTNELNILDSLDKSYNAYSDSLYITCRRISSIRF